MFVRACNGSAERACLSALLSLGSISFRPGIRRILSLDCLPVGSSSSGMILVARSLRTQVLLLRSSGPQLVTCDPEPPGLVQFRRQLCHYMNSDLLQRRKPMNAVLIDPGNTTRFTTKRQLECGKRSRPLRFVPCPCWTSDWFLESGPVSVPVLIPEPR